MLLQKWLPFTDGWNNLCAKSGNYFQSGRYFKLLWSEKCRIRGIGSVWDYEVSIMSSLLASDILCFMGYWECHLLSYYCLVFPKRCHIILPQNLKEVEWNKYGHGITNLWFISSVGQEWAVPCVISLWAHVSSDKSSRLSWSNEQTILTSLSDTKMSQTRECENLAAVYGGQAVTRLWLRQTSDSPSDKCVCFLSHANQTLGLALMCDWFWLLPCVIDLGCSPVWHSRGCEGMWVPLPRRELAALQVGAVLTPAFLPGWEWGLPAAFLCLLQDHVVPGLTLRVTETVISRHRWFLLCLLCDNAALRTAPGGVRTGTAAICGKSPRSQRVSRSDGTGLRVLGLGTALWAPVPASGWSWLSEMAIMTQGFIHPCLWKVILRCVSFAALVLLTLNAELNTVQVTCFCKIYTVLALIVVFPYLVQTHAERNAQNWSPS